MNAVECQNLSRSFGPTLAIKEVSLAIPEGSIFALLGPNGAGKSTTLKILLNLLSPTSGRASVLGIETTKLPRDAYRKIGYVTEEQIYPEWMTVDQLLKYYQAMYSKWDDKLQRRLVEMFNLPLDRPLRKLSRGMRVKAILLTILPFHPELLILDEPFGGLDPQVRDDFINGLLEVVSADRPNTVLVSSHDIAEVERLADWVGILIGGELVVAEPMATLQSRFRRFEVVGPDASLRIPERLPDGWRKVDRAASTVVQLIHGAFVEGATQADVRAVFGEVSITAYAMSLREIFLLHSSTSTASNAR